MTGFSIPSGAGEHQRPSSKQDQAGAWIRLIFIMTVPTLWLLAGITLFR